jgi:enterochelin esterase-like enzyme
MLREEPATYAHQTWWLKSRHLRKEKRTDIYLPPQFVATETYPLLLLNDGQDAEALQLKATLHALMSHQQVPPFVLAAVHADQDRLYEYGTAGIPDYANRGNLADAYSCFVLYELLPALRQQYALALEPARNAVAGFSLGGLAAFDLAWNHPQVFGRVGVFSGSFWWRRHGDNDELANTDRIIHGIVRGSAKKEGLRFWFQAGTHDETADRNHNGIIDAIEDTLDLVAELVMKGYDVQRDIRYVEVQNGQHNQHTWGQVLPDFLRWLHKVSG